MQGRCTREEIRSSTPYHYALSQKDKKKSILTNIIQK